MYVEIFSIIFMIITMSSQIKIKMKAFWISGTLFGLIFLTLFAIRLDLFNKYFHASTNVSLPFINSPPARDAWMNIFQNGRKIGFSHKTFSKIETGYSLIETLYMRINTMGLIQDISLKVKGILNDDFSLSSFDFEITSGRFRFAAKGAVSGDLLSIKAGSFDSTQAIDIKIKDKLYVAAGILDAVRATGMELGDEFTFNVFDPVTMGQEPVGVKIVGDEEIINMGISKSARKVAIIFKGATQIAWIGENGEVLKEKGMLGISLERVTRNEALAGFPVDSSQDLTKVASVISNVLIDDPQLLTRLDVEIGGIKFEDVYLEGGRQTFKGNILAVHKESLSGIPAMHDADKMQDMERDFLSPTPFIQSDHLKIKNLAKKVVSPNDEPLQKIKKIVAWIYKNIDKRPVLSIPDALSTLENGIGDCNEHAVLLAALARASGIPTKIEAGLVYLNGRFYYHAWNLLYIGKWITADSLFGQIPADVTHIRFTSGTQTQQLNLMNIIGKIKIKVVKQE
jgi:flavodoxin